MISPNFSPKNQQNTTKYDKKTLIILCYYTGDYQNNIQYYKIELQIPYAPQNLIEATEFSVAFFCA